ncbi:ribosome small subunit-dependent GTPase A [Undibacterium terreum]|uniref:ribosome small subunit-dependent GTPase A n=1 Tax=Undibacterium terreum TaxID=1224302 RepID=UPI001E40ADD7|nr:ribosome small subunit-dependent GTPase A [Undibacterium terreum]
MRVLPKLLADLQEQGENLAIGDWVLIRADAFGELWVNGLLPPLNQLARRANDGRRQVLAANIDTALLVMGLDHDFNLRRMERYIALVHASGIAALAVMSKADIGIDVDARLAQLRQRLPASVPVLAVNALDRQASVELAPWTGAGQTLVVLGSSGVGKSTLTNTLTASSSQQTGGNRKGDGRGRHTTTARSLHLCEGGACIIDTPGLRTWRPDADEQTLAATFTDIEALAEHCQFRDCCHQGEPGCAVAAAVPADRLLNYHKLLREARRSQQTHLERSAQLSKWKKISKAARQRSREKRA